MSVLINSALKHMALILCGLSLMTVTAHATHLEDAIRKAIIQKKGTKKVQSPNHHGFNVKKVNIATSPGENPRFFVKGRLSHRMSFKTDHQYHFEIHVDHEGEITKFRRRISRAKFIATASGWKRVNPNRRLGTGWQDDAHRIVRRIARQVAQHCGVPRGGRYPAYCQWQREFEY